MGFRSFCCLLVVGFLAGCGSTSNPQQGPYSGTNPNQNQMPPNAPGGQPPANGQGQPAVRPPGQGPTVAQGEAILPTTDLNNNPILTPSGVTGAPTGPVVEPNAGVINNGPATQPAVIQPPVVANGTQPPAQTVIELRGLRCPRTNVVYFNEQNAAAQAAWLAQQKITYVNYQWTLMYFQEMYIFSRGHRFFAFDGMKAAQLTNMVFAADPRFDIVQFDRVYRTVLSQGFLGYIAIDEALGRMGIRIATCRI